ncbi:MAG: hypothetical protein KJ718_05060 [Nanoarchaeota archaeon]|nr:hypothetical protein [Nanoarchaeota archaeon]MBU1051895.1 hypothetical protein [Nanoarchaeota archaeon]MBU1988938.1 hypothetical protein [Nanoarchaeota archaeon]
MERQEIAERATDATLEALRKLSKRRERRTYWQEGNITVTIDRDKLNDISLGLHKFDGTYCKGCVFYDINKGVMVGTVRLDEVLEDLVNGKRVSRIFLVDTLGYCIIEQK